MFVHNKSIHSGLLSIFTVERCVKSLFSSHALSARRLQLLRFLHEGTKSAAPRTQQIFEAGAFDPLLLANLASDGDAGPQVQAGHELGERAKNTAVTNCFGILPEDVAGTEVGDDAGRAVVETAKNPVTPLARHVAALFWLTGWLSGLRSTNTQHCNRIQF